MYTYIILQKTRISTAKIHCLRIVKRISDYVANDSVVCYHISVNGDGTHNKKLLQTQLDNLQQRG